LQKDLQKSIIKNQIAPENPSNGDKTSDTIRHYFSVIAGDPASSFLDS